MTPNLFSLVTFVVGMAFGGMLMSTEWARRNIRVRHRAVQPAAAVGEAPADEPAPRPVGGGGSLTGCSGSRCWS